MPHGGYDKRRVSGRKPSSNSGRQKGSTGINKKPKTSSLKNQIRSTERFLRKDLPPEVREAQQRKLDELKKQQELYNRLAGERKIFLRDKKIKFFERRKIERRIRRVEKQQRSLPAHAQEAKIADELAKLKEDLEYVKFFPRAEKYVPLYCGGDDIDLIEKRNNLRMQIKAKLVAAAASGKDLEETGSEDDGLVDLSDDDFFISGSSSDEADADDELTDISARAQASGKASSSMSSDERNQKQISARSLMPPPRPKKPSTSRANSSIPSRTSNSRNTSYSGDRQFTNSQSGQSSNISSIPSRTSNSRNTSYSGDRQFANSQSGQSSNISSNSEASRPRRKRRPKKKK